MLSSSTPRTRAALAASAALFCLSGAAACGSDADSAGNGKLAVVAAFYPLQFLAEQVGGDEVRVTNLVKPGAEPHDLELNPRQVASVADAKLVVYLKGFQPALDDTVSQEARNRAFDVTTVAPLVAASTGDNHEGAVPDKDDGALAGDQPSGSAVKDPHIWLDPTRFASIAGALADRLGKLDSTDAASFRSRAERVRAELAQLDTEYATGLKTCQRREIVTSHAAFGYLADRYHLTQVAISGISPDAEPSPQRLAAVARDAREHHATTIFFETLVSPELARTLANEIGAKAEVLDPIEGVQAGSGDDYLSVMRKNLTTLRTALGCS